MKSGELIGKPVIDSEAQILGKVCEIEFDTSTWKIIDIHMDLEKTVVETIGFQRPLLMGSVKVRIPTEEVNAIHDIVSLKKSIFELKGIARKV